MTQRTVNSASYVDHYAGARRQDWTTPRAFFDKLNAEFDFTLDGAADPENALLPRYETEVTATASNWRGERVFCNPPWANIAPFVESAAAADLAVLLVPARTNARWFHRALKLGAEVRFFVGKLKFGDAKWNSPVDCVLLVFGPKCVRCGAPYAPAGHCSMRFDRESPCQGGRGESGHRTDGQRSAPDTGGTTR